MHLGTITTRKPTEWEAYCHYLRQFAANDGMCLGIEPFSIHPWTSRKALLNLHLDKDPLVEYSESQQKD